jgi:hypothetical protein
MIIMSFTACNKKDPGANFTDKRDDRTAEIYAGDRMQAEYTCKYEIKVIITDRHILYSDFFSSAPVLLSVETNETINMLSETELSSNILSPDS